MPDMRLSIEERVDAIKRYLDINSNAELGRLCNTSRQTVNGWVNQGKEPSEESANALENNTDIRATFLRKGTGPMLKKDKDAEQVEKDVIQLLEQGTPEERSRIGADLIRSISKYL